MESGLPLWEFIWFIYVTFKLIRFFGLMASGKVWELIIPVGMNFGSQKELVSHSYITKMLSIWLLFSEIELTGIR